ncbi:predicted protein [Naegleria gruberi]|uniref:Predicted protein n=1 Tax=Naegleria gruberi TaxID=5762 RepID=D2W0Q5_NAEGR|nr:uncharacterized protein NAEGRDRAFT_53780 [Naegleria gruberi]EFC37334.1 predicted protein [Naegleria gruberi]|eukprot:XP_002670078.1 predicted protein [Naegleria gruberi strain NEG-M]
MYSNANYCRVTIRQDVPASSYNDNWQPCIPDPVIVPQQRNQQYLVSTSAANGLSNNDEFLSMFATLQLDSQEKLIRLYTLIFQLQQQANIATSPAYQQDKVSTDETIPPVSSISQNPQTNESSTSTFSSCFTTSTSPIIQHSNQVSSKITKPSKMKNQNPQKLSKPQKSQKPEKYTELCSSFRSI